MSKEVFEVAAILDDKKEAKKRFFKIRWKGFSAADDTWEPGLRLI